MTTPKAVAVIVDHPQRDLAGLTLTAVTLCRAGINCFLVPFNMMAREIWALRPNFVVLNYLRSTTERTVEGLRRAGIGYGVLDTEGAIWSSAEQYAGLLAPTPEVRSDLSCICMWGQELASFVVEGRYFRDDQVRITGCPRFDFYAHPWRSVLTNGDRGVENKTILINTNFTTVNSRYTTLEQTIALYRTGMADTEIRTLVARETEGLAQTLELVEYVSAEFRKFRIVLRPHPFEDATVYRNRLGLLDNVEINTEGAVQPQLFRAHVLIQRSCTTAVEAYMASIPTLSPQWVTPAVEVPMAEAVSVPCTSPAEMKQYIGDILAGCYHVPESVRQSSERVIRAWFHKNDGCAHERVSRAIRAVNDWQRTPDEASCSRLLYDLDARNETIWARMAAKTRYQLGLSPHWSFSHLRDIPPQITRPGKAFGVNEVRELTGKILAAEAAQGRTGQAVSVHWARESGAYSHGFQGASVELKPVNVQPKGRRSSPQRTSIRKPNTMTLSVVIRVRNEAHELQLVLTALHNQTVQAFETIVVDNESSDGSDQVARQFGAVVVGISRSEFTYGRALNIGIAKASGDIVVLLSAHAVPVGPEFLATILAAFTDPQIAGVRCLHAGKTRELKQWWQRPIVDRGASFADAVVHGTLNNGAAIRRSVWCRIKYDESIEACEDKVWTYHATRAGFKVAPCSAVYVYIKNAGPGSRARLTLREQVAAHRYGAGEIPQSNVDLLKSIILIWQEAIQNTYCQVLNYIQMRSVTRLAKQRPQPGSVQ